MASLLLAQSGRILAGRGAAALRTTTTATAVAGAAAAAASTRWISTSDPNSRSRHKSTNNANASAASTPSSASSFPSSSSSPAASSSSSPAAASTSNAVPPSTAGAADPTPQQAADISSLPSLDFTATSAPALSSPDASGVDKPTGARSSKESLSTIERRRRFLGRVGLVLVGTGLVGAWAYMGREWEDGEDIPQDGKEMGRIARANARLAGTTDVFDKPAWKELLPPPLPAPHQRPYTLLISIEDLMIASTWDREHGWRTMKRPGIEYFIGYLSQFYEIVVFTSQYAYSAIPVLEQIDPYTLYISYKLFRESTRSVDGKVVKDLSYLNRDLSKVVAIDTLAEHLSLQPENSIIIPKWKGEKEGRAGLVNLIPLLESIAIHRVDDVRPILKAYQGKDVALEFAKFEAEMKRQHIEKWKKSGGATSGVATSWLHKLLAGPQKTTPITSADGAPLTYLEQKRLEAQEIYRAETEYFKEQEPVFKKYLEDERERQAKEMSGSLFGMITGQSGPFAMLAKAQEEQDAAALTASASGAPSAAAGSAEVKKVEVTGPAASK